MCSRGETTSTTFRARGTGTLSNWRLRDLTGEQIYRAIATRSSQGMVARQRPDGAWDYPNREWKGRVANAEGTWASIGLLESFRQTGEVSFLDAVLRWRAFLEEAIGWQAAGRGLAVNYFAGRAGAMVPNNSAFVLRFLAELADATGDVGHLARCDALLEFIADAQMQSGELPYEVGGGEGDRRLEHFQCYQYNAFQCLDLMRYAELSGDPGARPLIAGLLVFLRQGVGADGSVPYRCGRRNPQVTYHAAAVAAALQEGARLGFEGCAEAAGRVWRRVLATQQTAGGFPHSRGDYGLLRDRRSYPRNLTMILHHLLVRETAAEAERAPLPREAAV